MTGQSDILNRAIKARLTRYSRDMWFHLLLGLAAIVIGAATFWFLWTQFQDQPSFYIKEIAGGATSLVTFGIGSIFAGKLLAIRDEIRTGEEWLSLYASALGPPPNGILEQVKAKILGWLEGP